MTNSINVSVTVDSNVQGTECYALATANVEYDISTQANVDAFRAFVITNKDSSNHTGITKLTSNVTGHEYHSGRGSEEFKGTITKSFANVDTAVDQDIVVQDEYTNYLYSLNQDGINKSLWTCVTLAKPLPTATTYIDFMNDTALRTSYNMGSQTVSFTTSGSSLFTDSNNRKALRVGSKKPFGSISVPQNECTLFFVVRGTSSGIVDRLTDGASGSFSLLVAHRTSMVGVGPFTFYDGVRYFDSINRWNAAPSGFPPLSLTTKYCIVILTLKYVGTDGSRDYNMRFQCYGQEQSTDNFTDLDTGRYTPNNAYGTFATAFYLCSDMQGAYLYEMGIISSYMEDDEFDLLRNHLVKKYYG